MSQHQPSTCPLPGPFIGAAGLPQLHGAVAESELSLLTPQGLTNADRARFAASLCAPNLVNRHHCITDDWSTAAWQQLTPQLQRFDTYPELLPAQLRQPRRDFRLGHYFEDLVRTWLETLPGVSKLMAGLQVQHQHRTLGEFDIVFSEQDQLRHWELAVKFYCLDGNPHNLSHWVGPDGRDNLAKKLARLEQHQLALAQKPAGQAVLQQNYSKRLLASSVIAANTYLKGWLFYPLRQWPDQLPSVPALHHGHWRGWWCRLAELNLPTAAGKRAIAASTSSTG